MTFLDQKPVKISYKKYDEAFSFEDDFLALAEKGVGEGLEDGLQTAEQYARLFVSAEESGGLALGKFLHGVNFRWNDFENEEEEPFWMWSVRATGRALATVQRRICTWEFLDGNYIPKDYYDSIRAFSTKMLAKAYVPFLRHSKNKAVGNYDFVPRDFEVEGKHWLKLSECADEGMVMDVVREITGREHADRMTIKIDSKGVLRVYKGRKEYDAIGQLFVDSRSALVQEGIAKLLEDANITEVGEY